MTELRDRKNDLNDENVIQRKFIALLQNAMMKASKKKFEAVMNEYGEYLMNRVPGGGE